MIPRLLVLVLGLVILWTWLAMVRPSTEELRQAYLYPLLGDRVEGRGR